MLASERSCYNPGRGVAEYWSVPHWGLMTPLCFLNIWESSFAPGFSHSPNDCLQVQVLEPILCHPPQLPHLEQNQLLLIKDLNGDLFKKASKTQKNHLFVLGQETPNTKAWFSVLRNYLFIPLIIVHQWKQTGTNVSLNYLALCIRSQDPEKLSGFLEFPRTLIKRIRCYPIPCSSSSHLCLLSGCKQLHIFT